LSKIPYGIVLLWALYKRHYAQLWRVPLCLMALTAAALRGMGPFTLRVYEQKIMRQTVAAGGLSIDDEGSAMSEHDADLIDAPPRSRVYLRGVNDAKFPAELRRPRTRRP
jgi:hypothetical protein